jgi:uncharacterized protein YkwD
MTPLQRFALALAVLAGLCASAAAQDMAAEVSRYRRAQGLSPVRMDAALTRLAQQQAAAMAAQEKVNHDAGGPFRTRVAPLRRRLAAENVAAGFLTFGETLKQWQASAGHRENLLMPGARRIGIAAVSKPSSPYRRFWAMLITD